MTYDVIWNGAHNNTDDDLLCVQPPPSLHQWQSASMPARHPSEPETTHERTQRIREQLIDLMREQEVWTTGELRRRLDQPREVVNGILQRAKAVGTIRAVEYGRVTLASAADHV